VCECVCVSEKTVCDKETREAAGLFFETVWVTVLPAVASFFVEERLEFLHCLTLLHLCHFVAPCVCVCVCDGGGGVGGEKKKERESERARGRD